MPVRSAALPTASWASPLATRRPFPRALRAGVAGLVVPAILGAQSAAQFRGRVTDSLGTPLAGVQVSVVEAELSARTDTAGRFAISGIPPGSYHMVLRSPGFGPIEGTGRFAAGDSIEMTFRMRRLAVSLDTVRSDTSAVRSEWQIDFEKRRAAGFGTFLTTQDYRFREGARLSDIIKSKVSGMELVRWNGHVYAFGTHAPQFPCGPPFGEPCKGDWPDKCYMQVYVDGNLEYADVADNSREPFDLDSFTPGQIAAIEVYSGAADTPRQFAGIGAACGTIVLWTHATVGR